ncbi:MAG: hypothetical protein LUH05_03875 [Candidatus Gastranaerophilales bacterium]|nr:hypothetical protein [Candidatus Gastranaerophilales bacterium]
MINKIISDERLFNNPHLMKEAVHIVSVAGTEDVQIVNKILSNDKLFNNPNFMKYAGAIVSSCEPENIEIKCNMLDKILSDEKLYNNPAFMKYAGSMVFNANITEQAQIVNKILSNEKLFNNPDFMKNLRDIIFYINSPERVQIADKILSDERLFNNPSFMISTVIGDMIFNTNTPEKVQVKCDLIDKILSDEKLFNNKNFMIRVRDIVYYTDTPEQAQIKCNLIDKILSDKRLYNNRDFMKKAGDIVSVVDTPEKAKLVNKILSDERLFGNLDFMKEAGYIVSHSDTPEKAQVRCDLIDIYLNDKEYVITPNQLVMLLQQEEDEISYKDLSKLNKTIGKEKAASLSKKDIILAVKFLPFYNRGNINEIPLKGKRDLLRNLVASNADLFMAGEEIREMFPMLPKNQEEYCALLPSIVRSIGIETNTLADEKVENFNVSLSSLSDTLKNISDEEFNNLDIKQEYSKDDFILDTLEKVKDLTPKERQKVYDYFGFELYHNKESKIGFSITGYPVNLNNGKKLAQITDPKTKAVIEDLRENVIRFSEDNHITCNNENVETLLNEIAASLPELRPMIGKIQHGTHDFDIMQHSLKVMKKIVENPEFNKLNESDKKIMLIASLLHDITKREGTRDKTHETEGSFDSFFIAKKFNLSREEEIKLHTLIKNHEWLGRVNRSKSEEELTKNIQSTAYDLRHDNLFDMSLIFTHADLKAVRKDDSFHDTKEGDERIDFRGNVRSYGESADYYAGMIKEAINELQKSQPILPITKLPSSDEIKSKIKTVNQDGSTNIKGVYEDKDGLVIIKYNEVEDWEAIGLPKGSISRGIKAKTDHGDTVNTGNIKFIAHGLNYPNQLAKFDAFSLINSDALLSVSYTERPESKYRLFKPQGVLLDVDTKYIHGGGETDAGSGYGKNIQNFKDNYIFGAHRENDRVYISNLIKKAAGMNDEEYVEFVRENSNKSFNEIEPVELREKLIKAFASINSHKRTGEREYNEMYISNPTPMGVFAYNMDTNGTIGSPVDFLSSNDVSTRTNFLKQYASEHNIPFVVFGD